MFRLLADGKPSFMTSPGSESMQEKKRNPVMMVLIVALVVLVPFLAWYNSWFGRSLSDERIVEILEAGEDGADIQHALSRIQQRLQQGDEGATRFRKKIIGLCEHELPKVRRMVAWTLGHDPDEACHQALRKMLADDDLATRRNAAVAVAKWKDDAGRKILLAILEPLEIRSPGEGVVDVKVEAGDAVTIGRDMAVIENKSGESVSLRPPMNGRVLSLDKHDGDDVSRGDLIGTLAPDPESAFAALKALFLVGRAEDKDVVEPYARGRVEHMTREVTQQAEKTLEKLRRL